MTPGLDTNPGRKYPDFNDFIHMYEYIRQNTDTSLIYIYINEQEFSFSTDDFA
jgi:hypothetical protein